MEKQLGFLKGMEMDTAPSLRDPNTYYSALNIRVITDDSLTTGSIVNDYGNKVLFSIPSLNKSYKIKDIKDNTSILVKINNQFYTLYNTNSNNDLLNFYNIIVNNSNILSLINSNQLKVVKNNTEIRFINFTDNFEITNISNGTLSFIYPDNKTPIIIGSTEIKDYLVIITTHPTIDNYTQIWRIKYDNNYSLIGLNNNVLSRTEHLVYVGLLNTKTTSVINEIVTKYWNDKFGKIYFITDQLRHINILDPDCLSTPEHLTTLYPEVNLSPIVFDKLMEGGNLKSGKVQYSYQLYNYSGVETVMSQTTPLINITSSFVNSNVERFRGDLKTIESGKACLLKINDIDYNFNYIKIYRVSYELENVANIHLIYDGPINNYNNFSFIDYGVSVLNTLTVEQFVSYGGVFFTPKTITSKNNYLIAGNIQEDFFDVDEVLGYYYDARAYRFKKNSSEFKIDDTVYTNFDSVPTEADCIYKDDYYFESDPYRYRRNSDVLGGTGKFVSYTIMFEDIPIDFAKNLPDKYVINQVNDDYTTYISSNKSAYKVGYMWEEYYRFGIEFIDPKGRRSFVKWIADVKFPIPSESKDYLFWYNSTYKATFAKLPYIKFEVRVPNALIGYRFRIVRVKREEWDKTVKVFGLFDPVYKNTRQDCDEDINDKYVSVINMDKSNVQTTLVLNNRLFKVISPDVSFKRISVNQNDTIVKYTFNISQSNVNSRLKFGYIDNNKVVYPLDNFQQSGWGYIYGNHNKIHNIQNITTNNPITKVKDSVIINDVSSSNVFIDSDTIAYSNRAVEKNAAYQNKYFYYKSGTGLLVKTTTDFTNTQPFYGIIKSQNPLNRYGGVSYSNRISNYYIPVSNVITFNSIVEEALVFGGDTFVQYFDYQNGYTVSGNGEIYKSVGDKTYHFYSVWLIPIYTTINTELRGDICHTKPENIKHIWKLQNTVDEGNELFQKTEEYSAGEYPSVYKNMYSINNVYFQENTLVKSFPKPLHLKYSVDHITKIICSEESFSGEVSDNWLKFVSGSSIQLDTNYGEINKLLVSNEKLIAIQDKAIAIIGFKDKKLIPDTGSSIVIGLGSPLSDYAYLSTNTGCIHPESVVLLDNNVMWYDGLSHKIVRFGERLELLSDEKKMSSLFKNFPNSRNQRVIGYYSKQNKRVYFSYYNYNISYNLMLGAFESFHSFYPYIWINSQVLDTPTVSKDNKTSVYVKDESSYTTYYGINYGFNIETVIGSQDYKLMFSNIEMNVDPKTEHKPYQIILSNSYVPGKIVQINDMNFIRRFRTYRFIIPRVDNTSRQRFIDYYLKFGIYFNKSNQIVRLDNLIVKFMVPMV